MHSIFERSLLTDQGKAAVRSHENKDDAQTVYKYFLYYRTNSVKASLTASSQLKWLAVARVNEYKGIN